MIEQGILEQSRFEIAKSLYMAFCQKENQNEKAETLAKQAIQHADTFITEWKKNYPTEPSHSIGFTGDKNNRR